MTRKVDFFDINFDIDVYLRQGRRLLDLSLDARAKNNRGCCCCKSTIG